MQHIQTTETPRLGGGRTGSVRHRAAQQLSDEFCGLERSVNRYDLLLLVKRIGKAAGFTPKMIHLLDYYMAFTRDIDWEEGASPIVYQSLAKTALDLGVSERQVQRLENDLFEAGAITWHDSGNHRRYGQRCPHSGAILYAFGVDLTPLAYLATKLQEKLHEKELHDKAWMETKRQISWYRAQIRGAIAELDAEEGASTNAWQQKYDDLAVPIRTYLSLEKLRTLLAEHKALHDRLKAELPEAPLQEDRSVLSPKPSSKDDRRVAHNKNTNQESFDKSNTRSPSGNRLAGSVAETVAKNGEVRVASSSEEIILSTGLQHITLKQALNAASERFREHIPMEPRPLNWNDMTVAAYELKKLLRISDKSWAEACEVLTRPGATICLLLTDRASLRENDPVRKPAAYFRALVKRAQDKDLKLRQSIFALLERKEKGRDGY